MRQLKQQGTTGPEKDGGFPVDPLGQRGRAKNALDRSRSPRPDEIKSNIEVVFGNQLKNLSFSTKVTTFGISRQNGFVFDPCLKSSSMRGFFGELRVLSRIFGAGISNIKGTFWGLDLYDR